jgi:LuxR family quorum sensing-dependent transcriptional regulator
VATQYPVALDFIDQLERLTTADSVWGSLLAFSRQYGLDHGALVDLPAPGQNIEETVLCVSWPDEWQRRYLDKDYVKRDPAVLHMMRARDPYTWQDMLNCPDYNSAQRRVVHEAAEFDLHNGFIVPLFGLRSGTAMVTFAGENTDLTLRERAELHLIAIYAHARIRALSPHRHRYESLPALSERERECLQWASAGKTDWEIGEILSISEKTANAHIERAKRKYNVATRVQAVVMALRAGEIQV